MRAVAGLPHAHVTETLHNAHQTQQQPVSADHVIGESVIAPSAELHSPGESISGVVAAIQAATADGGVVARLASGNRVTLTQALVEATRPKDPLA